jgi:hypothetical protein
LSQLTQKNVNAIGKLQKRYKAYLVKKKLIKAIEMNKRQRHYNNYQRLKGCIKKHENSKKTKNQDSYFDVFMRLWQS